jgi:hypothetical protein
MRTFAEFWPHYAREHTDPNDRRLHLAGTLSVVVLAVALLATGR